MQVIGIRGMMWRMMKNVKEWARSAVMLDGEISKHVDITQGVARRFTLSIYSRYRLMA